MKVIDLLIALQQLPPNMEVMIDQTNENMDWFKFGSVVSVQEVTTSLDEKIVLISHQEFEEDELT